MEIQDIRNVPVENYLQALGYAPVRKSANELLYHAPYREDRRPSFRVNVAKGLWFDFGLSKEVIFSTLQERLSVAATSWHRQDTLPIRSILRFR